jgi:hypothetical protein
MKHKMTVITDKNGAFLGAVRNGTIQDGENMFFAVLCITASGSQAS